MARTVAVAVSLLSLALLAMSAACGGGGGQSSPTPAATLTAPASSVSTLIDIRDFDTAHLTMSQTTTAAGDVAQLAGEGVIDNRQQAISLTYQGEVSASTIAIGRTIYVYNQEQQRWVSYTEPTDGQVGFGRPYWPQFWQDAAEIQNLGAETLQGVATTHYLVTFDLERVKQRLQPGGTGGEGQAVDVRQAEVEVWVDKDSRYAVQLIFRLELVLDSQSEKIEITSTFSDFGADVQIQAPEAASATPAPTEPAPAGQ